MLEAAKLYFNIQNELVFFCCKYNYRVEFMRFYFNQYHFFSQSSIANSSFSCSNIEIRSHENIWTDDMSEEQSMVSLQLFYIKKN